MDESNQVLEVLQDALQHWSEILEFRIVQRVSKNALIPGRGLSSLFENLDEGDRVLLLSKANNDILIELLVKDAAYRKEFLEEVEDFYKDLIVPNYLKFKEDGVYIHGIKAGWAEYPAEDCTYYHLLRLPKFIKLGEAH